MAAPARSIFCFCRPVKLTRQFTLDCSYGAFTPRCEARKERKARRESAQGGLPSPFKACAVPSARRLCDVPPRRRHFPAEVSLMKTIFWKTLFFNALLLCAVLLIVFGVTRSGADVNDKKTNETVSDDKSRDVVNDKNPNERKTHELDLAVNTTGSMDVVI